jgi:hypothetical protein
MARHDRMKSGAGGRVGTGSSMVSVPAAILCLVFLSSCTPDSEPKALVPDDYDTWGRTTDLKLDYPIPGHEDNFRIIYMNDTGFGFSRTMEGQAERVVFPEGTVIAKAIYEGASPEPGATPMMVTAMVKASDNPAARGGWVWVTKDLAMGKEMVITGDFCLPATPMPTKDIHMGTRTWMRDSVIMYFSFLVRCRQ